MLEDARGSLWIATPSGLYRRWPDGTAARYTARDGLPSDDLSDILEDHEGRLWVATRLNGFFGFSADATHRAPVVDRRVTPAEGLPTSWVFQLFETSDRRFWVATDRGVVEFFATAEEQGRRFRHYTEENGLSYYDITALNEDLGGNLWLGTNSAGAMKLTRDGFNTYGEADAIKAVNAIFEDRAGHVCFKGNVLGDARTSVFEGAQLDLLRADHAEYPYAARLFRWPALRLVQARRRVRLRLGHGAGHAAGPERRLVGRNRGRAVPLSSRRRLHRNSTRPDRWLFTRRKTGWPVCRYSGFSKTREATSGSPPLTRTRTAWLVGNASARRCATWPRSPGLPSLKDDLPRSFGEDGSGNVWVGFNNGLARYAQGTFTFFTAAEGLPPGAIVNIHVDRSGRLWLASARGGLVRVDGLGAERPAFVAYTTAQGLSSNNTEVITEDADGHIYVGGGHGLDRLDPRTGRVKHFTTADGLAPGLFRAAFRDRTGVLWFGMTSGLSRLAPVREKPAAPPPVLISGLRVRGVPRLVSAFGEREMSLPDFPPDENQLQIDFVGLGFGSGDVLRYQYRLEGADADWSALDRAADGDVREPCPGPVHVRRPGGELGRDRERASATITFTILRPVWQRWWFLALMALAVGLTGHALYRYRVARLLEMANMRTRIATDLHDDIGANLTRIALLSEVAAQKRGDERSRRGGSRERRRLRRKMDRSSPSRASPASRSAP